MSQGRRNDLREELTDHRRSARVRRLSEKRPGLGELGDTDNEESSPNGRSPALEDLRGVGETLGDENSEEKTEESVVSDPIQPQEPHRRGRGRPRQSLVNTYDQSRSRSQGERPLRGKSKSRLLPFEDLPRAQRREGHRPTKVPKTGEEELSTAMERVPKEEDCPSPSLRGSQHSSGSEKTDAPRSRDEGAAPTSGPGLALMVGSQKRLCSPWDDLGGSPQTQQGGGAVQ